MTYRLKAFSLHLAISTLAGLAVMFLVFLGWYPSPLANATGVTQIVLMLLAIDVVLGPTLTLLVCKPGKKTLLIDLSVIACLQLIALLYGLYSLAEGRPAWLVFSSDRFDLVRFNEIDDRKLNEAAVEYRTPSWTGPQWVIAINPEDQDAKNEILFEAVLGGIDLAQRPNLYQPLSQHSASIAARILPLEQLKEFNKPSLVQSVLNTHPAADGWLALAANHQDMVVLMESRTARIVAIVNLRPW